MKTLLVLHQNYIRVQYFNNYDRLRISTGVRINDKTDFHKGKLKCNVPDYKHKQFLINKKQQEIEFLITQYYNEHKEYPPVKIIKGILNGNGESITSEQVTSIDKNSLLLTHFSLFMKVKESDFSLPGKRPSSIKDYRNVFFYLEDYEKYLNRKVKLEDVNKQWLNGFVNFLQTPREGRRFFSKGNLVGKTIKKRIVMLLSFFKWMDSEDKFTFPKNLRGYSKNIADTPTVKTTFTKEEVIKIYEYSTENKQHQFVRDVFVFSCYTGLRWSDLISLNQKHIKFIEGIGQVVDKQTMKTREKVIIPLNTVAYDILKRWNYNFYKYDNAAFNKALKVFLHKTGYFESETEFAHPHGGFKKVYEIISIHRGRDIFITSLLNSRVPVPEVMKYTGHKSMTTLMGYVDLKTQVKNYTDELLKI